MSFVRIDLPKGESAAYHRRLGECIQETMHEALGVPAGQCFQTITTHPPGALMIDRNYLGVARSDEAIIVQIFLISGCDTQAKTRFYTMLAERLHDGVGLRAEDLVISLVEVKSEDWSFGNGHAQLLAKGVGS